MKRTTLNSLNSFTLIELIAGIVLLSFVATGVVTFLQSMAKTVRQSEVIVVNSMQFKQVCAEIRSDFEVNHKTDSDLSIYSGLIGTSGTQTNSFGTYRVLASDFVLFNESASVYTETITGSNTDYLRVKIAHITSPETAVLIFHL